MDPRHQLGEEGEISAQAWLQKRRLRVMDRRYRTRYGEIDLIARDGDTWVFVEVKTRSTAGGYTALDAITPAKCKRLARAAYSYIRHKRLIGQSFRFDFLLIEAGRVEWIPNAFDIPEYWTL